MKVKFNEKESFLEEVSLREIPCSLTIKDKGEQVTLSFRLLTPEVVDGHWKFMEDIIRSFPCVWEEIEGEEGARYRWLLRMIRFHKLFPGREQMRGTRRFHIDFSRPRPGEKPAILYQMAREAGTKDVMDLIRYVTKRDKIPPSSEKLLAKAIYREPTLKIPFSRESYYEFRDESMKWWEALDDLVVKVPVPKMIRGEKDPVLEKMSKRDPSGYEKARRSPEESEKFIIRQLLKDELKDQEEIAQRYGPILERAENLYRKYIEKGQKGKNGLTDSGFSNEFDPLMNECISQFKADVKRKKVLRVRKDEIKTEEKQVYIDSLKQSITSKDASIKWSALIGLIENLTYRGSAIRLMQREAEGVCLGLVHYGINEIYQKIRRNLTLAKKRAFILAHFRQYKVLGKQSPVFPLGGRIPVLDRIIWDFFWEIGETTKGLVCAVLIFKHALLPDVRRALAEELRQRWSRYLMVYPAWEDITRRDDRERKYQEVWKKRKLSLETPVGEDREGRTPTLGDTLQDDLLRSPEVSERRRKEAYRLIDRFSTPREAEILKLSLEEYTQQKIADIVGKKEGRTITQQAISKIIKKAIRKIVEGDSRTK